MSSNRQLPAFPKVQENKTRLPADFSPSPYSVLIGRGKACSDAMGNRRLKVIVSSFLNEYSQAPSRIGKSIIVSKIVDIVQDACPVGGFVKHEDGAWWQVSDDMARERVGSMLRDALHERYKSSSKAKLARRRKSMTGTKEGVQGSKMVKDPPKTASPGVAHTKPNRTDLSITPGQGLYRHHQVGSGSSSTSIYDPSSSNSPFAFPLSSSAVQEDMTRIDLADVLSRRLPCQVGRYRDNKPYADDSMTLPASAFEDSKMAKTESDADDHRFESLSHQDYSKRHHSMFAWETSQSRSSFSSNIDPIITFQKQQLQHLHDQYQQLQFQHRQLQQELHQKSLVPARNQNAEDDVSFSPDDERNNGMDCTDQDFI